MLDDYDGVEGNKNYVKYCRNKAMIANEDDSILVEMYSDTYNVDFNKRKEINLEILFNIIKKHFKLLDNINTASDIFKPKWCNITTAVNKIQKSRFMVATLENDFKDTVFVNNVCFKREDRVILDL